MSVETEIFGKLIFKRPNREGLVTGDQYDCIASNLDSTCDRNDCFRNYSLSYTFHAAEQTRLPGYGNAVLPEM